MTIGLGFGGEGVNEAPSGLTGFSVNTDLTCGGSSHTISDTRLLMPRTSIAVGTDLCSKATRAESWKGVSLALQKI